MPDRRKHRGPHPHDADYFHDTRLHTLRVAVEHFSWLLTREYSPKAAIKLVGDRFQLGDRQRTAVVRSSCSDGSLRRRASRLLKSQDVAGQDVEIDGFNLVTTLEAALSGGVILVGRDHVARDMASMHGSYRRVAETRPALQFLGQFMARCGILKCHWLLDRPVSNSGRLAQMIREIGSDNSWNWSAELVDDTDPVLKRSKHVVATGDSVILDSCEHWVNLAWEVVHESVPEAWVIKMQPHCDSDNN